MLLFDLPSSIIYEISTYLKPEELFFNCACICKEANKVFDNDHFKIFWIKNHLNLTLDLSLYDLKCTFLDINSNTIVNFKPWFTNGGVSTREYRNSYANMWKYNADTYSTYYEEGENLKLIKNICCTAYFNGKIQYQNFTDGFYSDVYQLTYNPESLNEKYNIEDLDHTKVLILDPLSNEKIDNYEDYDLKLYRPASVLNTAPTYKIRDTPKFPNNTISIVKKIAIARPVFFTGCVKSLIFIFSENSYTKNFETFNAYNDIENIEKAKSLGNINKIEENNEFEWVEYNNTGKDYYPVLWMQFKTWKVNHIVINLTKCHHPKFVCVKFIDIDDRRSDWDLEDLQPNFDITYSLMLGSVVNLE
ncbi:hypothetical protein SteCoe_21525 [Stentor coeruleus]|uniref:F-box domain-containing protein n=1 Tax=Stentor coeruleus TaxID=5963 RepID=A0A1R2BPB9_9CILI|nr:hypothetical protein SteCoe_21525 [Stentor coeruleus]